MKNWKEQSTNTPVWPDDIVILSKGENTRHKLRKFIGETTKAG